MKQQVLDFLLTIPKGKVSTYKLLAEHFNTHPRAIAMFMKTNKQTKVFPCYKVVQSDGNIGGYSGEGGIEKKRELLETDGVIFEGDKVSSKSFFP